MRWITGLLAGSLASWWLASESADARGRSRMICEEWRDYYYNVQTGEFLGWAGEPYMQCFFEDEPLSVPDGPSPERYRGWGIPREPSPAERCETCKQNKQACDKRTERGLRRCLTHYRKQARTICVTTRRDRRGRLLDDYTCEPIETPSGKPKMTCYGPGIERCVEDYAQSHPETTRTNTRTINMGADWWGAGGDQTTTVTWGGSRGFIQACRIAYRTANDVCLTRQTACEEAAGGCR